MRRHQQTKPMRRCIACRASKPQDELMRFTLTEKGIEADTAGSAEGRGYYLCRSRECMDSAVRRRAFNRACRRNFGTDEIIEVIEQALAYDRVGGINVKEG